MITTSMLMKDLIFFVPFIFLLIVDLWVHRQDKEPSFKSALGWTTVWVALALIFNTYLWMADGSAKALQFFTGYLVELSLSVDNLFVIMMIFSYFHVPKKYQHRVLFWGILGALVMRGVFIILGVQLIQQFEWMMMVFGGFLIFTGIKTAIENKEESSLAKNKTVQILNRFLPVHAHFEEEKFWVKIGKKWKVTPLFLALAVVEVSDLIFAVDSIPAILGISSDSFIVVTSNFFAILGLRSMYFVLNRMLEAFHFLKYALGVILTFVGVKMVIADWVHIPTSMSLSVIISSLVVAAGASYYHQKYVLKK